MRFQPRDHINYQIRTKDMHLYELPWPKDLLESLQNMRVEMKITLSYFIEPTPGLVKWSDRYQYASFALGFEINLPTEDKNAFVKRINAAAREEDEEIPKPSSKNSWYFGKTRDKGSIHSDIWHGSAIELASSNLIAIFPKNGWWKERSHLNKYDNIARYSLIISITTSEQKIDIYTPIRNKVLNIIPTTIFYKK